VQERTNSKQDNEPPAEKRSLRLSISDGGWFAFTYTIAYIAFRFDVRRHGSSFQHSMTTGKSALVALLLATGKNPPARFWYRAAFSSKRIFEAASRNASQKSLLTVRSIAESSSASQAHSNSLCSRNSQYRRRLGESSEALGNRFRRPEQVCSD